MLASRSYGSRRGLAIGHRIVSAVCESSFTQRTIRPIGGTQRREFTRRPDLSWGGTLFLAIEFRFGLERPNSPSVDKRGKPERLLVPGRESPT